MRDHSGYGNLKRLIKPINVVTQDKVSNNNWKNKGTPVRKKNDIKRNKARKNLKEPINLSVIPDDEFSKHYLVKTRKKRLGAFYF